MNVPAVHLKLGYVDRRGHVSISWEHGCYHVKRNPAHPAGWRRETATTVREARSIAAMLRREGGPR